MIVCLGASANTLPDLSGKLPLRTCRGVVAELHLPTPARYHLFHQEETSCISISKIYLWLISDFSFLYFSWSREYADQSPSILSDAWLAFQGPRNVYVGSTWDWNSKNYDQSVSKEEASQATEELVSRASVFYPEITKWSFAGAKAGLRAMPPLTGNGSMPLLGCLNDLIGDKGDCMFWLVGGLGARGLLYHGLVGKLTSQAVISCDESMIPFEFTHWKRKRPCIVNWTGSFV